MKAQNNLRENKYYLLFRLFQLTESLSRANFPRARYSMEKILRTVLVRRNSFNSKFLWLSVRTQTWSGTTSGREPNDGGDSAATKVTVSFRGGLSIINDEDGA